MEIQIALITIIPCFFFLGVNIVGTTWHDLICNILNLHIPVHIH